ncbi:hypothetical protein QZH56_37160 (plasmid) [Streptomyces olivoreticuli]|uniref:hypothetical protein n=1 Tax=Streptomyces olivoreticuli TaxID=68246 RepID=UPI002657E46A|nr:hypothetical protein [Streptomyces olivoreticuli]WKK27819.1 hypothetical protein QZH56_37160 [Streptomyces olivoreticuli]
MTSSATETTATALALPAVLCSGRRRITHVSAALLDALTPYVRAGCEAERSAVLASLLALAADVDADADGQEVTEPHLTGGAPIDCAPVPALGEGVRLHLRADGGFLAALAHEAAPTRQNAPEGSA